MRSLPHSAARPRIVLLGCSFAGLEFLRRYSRRVGAFAPGEVTVVDPRAKHSYIPLAHETASGVRPPEHLLFDSAAWVASLHAEWITSGAKSLDPAARTVTLENGRTLAYDRCVIAVGSVPDVPAELDGAAGVIAAKWVPDALALHQRLRVLRATGARMMRVIVAGGGITAVEWSAELASARVEGTRIAVTLIGAAPRLLPDFDPHIARRIAGTYPDDSGPSHRLRPDFWYGLSLGAKRSAVLRGPRISEREMYVQLRRGLQWAYYRRFTPRA